MKTIGLFLFTLVATFLVLSMVAISVLKKQGVFDKSAGYWPLYAKLSLTKSEKILYYRIVKALPEHIVLTQVQVSRILDVKKGFNFHVWNNRVNHLNYDFVVYAKDSTVLAAIDLDDKSRQTESRRVIDQKKNLATTAAGIRMIRWQAHALPAQEEIQAAFS